MRQVFDRLRRQWVAATPEEMIRQSWLEKMVGELGYPPAYLAVEKELKSLPHLATIADVPHRRIDILSFKSEREPLLLIECKQRVTDEAVQQVAAYNHFVQAVWFGVASRTEIRLKCRDREIDYLPPFGEL